MILSSCCRNQKYNNVSSIINTNNNANIPLHRLVSIERPQCGIFEGQTTYKDLIYCLVLYSEALEQSNSDKAEIIKILNSK